MIASAASIKEANKLAQHWVAFRHEDQIRAYAARSRAKLRSLLGMGLQELRTLAEMLSAARPTA
jgi:hypothetical protein